MADASDRAVGDAAAMRIVILVDERQPPVGHLQHPASRSDSSFSGWLELLGLLETLLADPAADGSGCSARDLGGEFDA